MTDHGVEQRRADPHVFRMVVDGNRINRGRPCAVDEIGIAGTDQTCL